MAAFKISGGQSYDPFALYDHVENQPNVYSAQVNLGRLHDGTGSWKLLNQTGHPQEFKAVWIYQIGYSADLQGLCNALRASLLTLIERRFPYYKKWYQQSTDPMPTLENLEITPAGVRTYSSTFFFRDAKESGKRLANTLTDAVHRKSKNVNTDDGLVYQLYTRLINADPTNSERTINEMVHAWAGGKEVSTETISYRNRFAVIPTLLSMRWLGQNDGVLDEWAVYRIAQTLRINILIFRLVDQRIINTKKIDFDECLAKESKTRVTNPAYTITGKMTLLDSRSVWLSDDPDLPVIFFGIDSGGQLYNAAISHDGLIAMYLNAREDKSHSKFALLIKEWYNHEVADPTRTTISRKLSYPRKSLETYIRKQISSSKI
jgi:hypothetical protein